MDKSVFLLTVFQDLSSKIHEIKEQAFRRSDCQDLSVANLHYIDVISTLHNPTFVELAKKLGLSKPSVTIMVNKLLEKGYVQKTRSPDDGRVFYITLTAKGRKIATSYHEAQQKVVEYISSKLTPKDVETLIVLLTKIS